MKTLAKEEGVQSPTPDLLGHLEILINTIIPGNSRDDLQEILEMRCTIEEGPLSMIDDEALEVLHPQLDQKVRGDV